MQVLGQYYFSLHVAHSRHLRKKNRNIFQFTFLRFGTIQLTSDKTLPNTIGCPYFATVRHITAQRKGNYVFFFTVPAAGFTQRATIDPETGEIHALSVSDLSIELQVNL